MAQRFGGKFSPDAVPRSGSGRGTPSHAQEPRRPNPVGARANLLFVPPALLVFFSLDEGAVGLIMGLAGAAALTAGAFLLREGLRAEDAYHARKVARRPALPRKMLAAAFTGLGAALAAYSGDPTALGAGLYGLAAAALHVAAFGIDPLADKRMAGIDSFQQDRVARVVDEAEAHLRQMREPIAALNDRALIGRVEAFQSTARRMFRTVESDPRDLTGARKYLSVYLLGARDASIKFAEVYGRSRDQQARADYEALLSDLQDNFAARTEKMLTDDRSDMDVEIKVLRDRLQREGVAVQR